MKILSIIVSNVRSFAPDESGAMTIAFDTSKPNILIGPNGSGKSNLLEIITRIFTQYFFEHVQMDWGEFANAQGDYTRVIKPIERRNIAIFAPNHGHETEPQQITLRLQPDEQDLANLRWLLDHTNDLRTLAGKFSSSVPESLQISVSANDLTGTEVEIVLGVEEEYYQRRFITIKQPEDAVSRLFIAYLRDYELINRLIKTQNVYLDPKSAGNARLIAQGLEDKTPWVLLKPSFSLIEPHRSYSSGSLSTSIGNPKEFHDSWQSTSERTKNTSVRTVDSGEPAEFTYLKNYLARKVNELILTKHDKPGVIDLLNQDNIMVELNVLLNQAIGARLSVKDFSLDNRNIELRLKIRGKSVDISDLSSGQCALFYLAVRLASYEDNSGLLLIDEPENHLHPALQKMLLAMLARKDKQVILATHSPVFVNENSINGVKRFYWDLNREGTAIVVGSNTSGDADLISFLSYSNASRIFFTDKVLMVEGETDEYFLRAYLEKVQPGHSVEVLNIGGKDAYSRWKKFLDEWRIQSYFIGDYDAVKDFKIASESQYVTRSKKIEDLRKDANTVAHHFGVYERDKTDPKRAKVGASIKELIKASQPVVRPENLKISGDTNDVEQKIETRYVDGVFILKQGVLEDYLGIPRGSKGKAVVVDFCRNGFQFPSDDYKQEIDTIIARVITSK